MVDRQCSHQNKVHFCQFMLHTKLPLGLRFGGDSTCATAVIMSKKAILNSFFFRNIWIGHETSICNFFFDECIYVPNNLLLQLFL